MFWLVNQWNLKVVKDLKKKIAPNHIINMLYAFTGQDLVPYFRKSITKHNPTYIEWANECFLKVDNILDINDSPLYTKEFVATKKSYNYSPVTTSRCDWELVYYTLKLVEDDAPRKLHSYLLNTCGIDIKDHTFDSAMIEVYKKGMYNQFNNFIADNFKVKYVKQIFEYGFKINKCISKPQSETIEYYSTKECNKLLKDIQ